MNTKEAPYILLVEDKEQDEVLTKKVFEKNNIRNLVKVARDGEEALDMLFNENSSKYLRELPQIVLLDLILPKIDGITVLKEIRSHPRTKILPVIILTTSKEESHLVAGYEYGVNSFIRKPVNFNDFAEVVKNIGTYWLLLNERGNY